MLLSFQFSLFFSPPLFSFFFLCQLFLQVLYLLVFFFEPNIKRSFFLFQSSFHLFKLHLENFLSFFFLFFNATVVPSPAVFLECPLFADLFLAAVYAGNFLSTPCASFRFATVAPSLSDLFVKVLLDCLSLPAAAPASAVVSKGLLFAGPFLRAVDATHFLLPPSP